MEPDSMEPDSYSAGGSSDSRNKQEDGADADADREGTGYDTQAGYDTAEQWRSLVGFASAVTGDQQLGEDLAQIAFTELITTACEVRDTGAWLRTVVLRRAKNHWRSLGRERDALRRLASTREHSSVDVTDRIGPRDSDNGISASNLASGNLASGNLASSNLAAAIERLSPRQRAAVLLVYGEDRSNEEAARILHCAPATLRVHLHRARNRLRRVLQDPQEADDHG